MSSMVKVGDIVELIRGHPRVRKHTRGIVTYISNDNIYIRIPTSRCKSKTRQVILVNENEIKRIR